MYCKQCGKQIEDDSNFCRHCGVSVRFVPTTLEADLFDQRIAHIESRMFPEEASCVNYLVVDMAKLLM